MIIDKESHRELLLRLISTTTIGGGIIDEIYEIKQAILNAKVVEEKEN
jgi:hypothetical protein